MKMFFKFGLILFVFTSTIGCSLFNQKTSVDYEEIADKITANTAWKLEKEKNLLLIGTGGGMMHDIQAMHMSFQLFHEVSLEEARELVVYAMREYLSNINNSEEVRPYLHNYPFTEKNIEIMILIYGPDKRELPPEKIYCITSHNGILKYYNRLDRDHPICKETYEEAVQKTYLDL